MTLSENIGKAIKHFRKERGLNQTELGKLSETSQNSISQMEKGHTMARQSTITKMCSALEIDEIDLLEYCLKKESLKDQVFTLANKLTIAGHSEESVKMHMIHKQLNQEI